MGGLEMMVMRGVLVVAALLCAVASAKEYNFDWAVHLPDPTKLTHVTQVPEKLAVKAMESVEDLPGFGNDDAPDEEIPEGFDMNTVGAVDEELADIALLQTSDVEVGIMPPTRAAANKGKGVIQRVCMNECGGLCRTLCSKFKALKVCNGCVRGCINKCGTGEMIPNNPFFDPFHVPKPGSLPSMGRNATNTTKVPAPASAPIPAHRA